jgi:hypothetical protein
MGKLKNYSNQQSGSIKPNCPFMGAVETVAIANRMHVNSKLPRFIMTFYIFHRAPLHCAQACGTRRFIFQALRPD